MSNLPELLLDAIPKLQLLKLIKDAEVASLTYLVADTLSTLEDEINLIWPSRLSFMKIIYLFNRYSPFVDSILIQFVMFITRSPEQCRWQWITVNVFYTAGNFASEAILIMRTLALFNFNRTVCVILGLLTSAVLAVCIFAVQAILRTLQYPGAEVLAITGCVPNVADLYGLAFYSVLLLLETVIVAFTIFQLVTTRTRGHTPPPIVYTMYRDGTLFYMIIVSLSIANPCCMAFAPKAANSVFQQPLRVVHSTLCSRVLLNLRKAALHGSSNFSLGDEGLAPTNVVFELTGFNSYHVAPVTVELEAFDGRAHARR
ncbi:hypothetical protein C8Q80DRAFT_782737 [Daedaleopsis nitida]|nr:hypothetical protein C8Q80DRAFT_782737 [Daedaleopsis nitida]